MRKTASGFTIVELLIVIIVIAILAALTIAAYNGIQGRVHDSALKSDLSAVKKKMAIAQVDNGHFPAVYAELPTDLRLTKGSYADSQNNAYLCVNTDNDSYAFGVVSKSGNKYFLSSAGGIQDASGQVTQNTTCDLVGKTWAGTGTYVRQFFATTGTTWYAPWGS